MIKMTNMPTAGAKKVSKTCQTMHSGMTSRELVFHPQEGALAVEARPGDHYQLYPFDHFQSNGPIKSATVFMFASPVTKFRILRNNDRFRIFNN